MPEPFICAVTEGCENHAEHEGPRGCVRYASDGSWVNDLSRPDGGHG